MSNKAKVSSSALMHLVVMEVAVAGTTLVVTCTDRANFNGVFRLWKVAMVTIMGVIVAAILAELSPEISSIMVGRKQMLPRYTEVVSKRRMRHARVNPKWSVVTRIK
jgi:hypothetical protein